MDAIGVYAAIAAFAIVVYAVTRLGIPAFSWPPALFGLFGAIIVYLANRYTGEPLGMMPPTGLYTFAQGLAHSTAEAVIYLTLIIATYSAFLWILPYLPRPLHDTIAAAILSIGQNEPSRRQKKHQIRASRTFQHIFENAPKSGHIVSYESQELPMR